MKTRFHTVCSLALALPLATLLYTPLATAQTTVTDTRPVVRTVADTDTADATPSVDAAAEPLDISDYYVVELSVFSYKNPKNAEEESWPKTLELAYPQPLALLTEQSIDAVYPELLSGIAPVPAPATEAAPTETPAEDTDGEQPLPAPLSLPLTAPFQQHQDAVKRIRQSSRYDLLLHQTWLQKLGSANDAPNIVIQAGEQAPLKQQLGGTLKLYKERYIHLRTNLWLVNYGEAVPVELELEVEEPATEPTPATDNGATETIIVDAGTDEAQEQAPVEDTVVEIQWPTPPALPEWQTAEESPEVTDASTQTEAAPDTTTDLIDLEAEVPLAPSIERIVLMQQKRRMRSLEQHYIDHPLLGVLIELRPYKMHKEQQ